MRMAGRLLPLLLGAGVLAVLLPFAGRDLWFDEALTVLQFANLPSAGAVYFSYVIPNNQIVHTLFLRFFLQTVPPDGPLVLWLRALPVFSALAAVLVMYFRFRNVCGKWCLAAVLAAWIMSPAFAIYGTALRGYMLSCLWIALALAGAADFAADGRLRSWAIWAGASLLAVGTIPTNLLGLAAAVLYVLPWFGVRFYRRRRFWVLALTPPVMLALFYLPILPAFLGCCRLREGWSDGLAAWRASMLPVAVAFAAMLLPAGLGAWFAGRSRGAHWIKSVRAAVWLLPLAVCMVMPVAPFPRTFFPLWPVLIVLLASCLRHFAAGWFGLCRRRPAVWFCVLMVPAAVLWGVMTDLPAFRTAFAMQCGGENADDYFAPYYMRDAFSPSGTVRKLRELDPEWRGQLYCSFCADPWSMLFALLAQGVPGEYCLFDGPARKAASLPDGAFVLLRRDELPAEIEKRFGGRLVRLTDCGRTRLYRFGL